MRTSKEIWLEHTESTMDDGKKYEGKEDYFFINAKTQHKGRGTQGRSWISPKGNVFLTIGILKNKLNKNRKKLFHIESGLIIANAIKPFIKSNYLPMLELKWPNDILINQLKVCGILIETGMNHILIGIGINVNAAPNISDGGRASGKLSDYRLKPFQNKHLILSIFNNFMENIEKKRAPEAIISEWKSMVNWKRTFRLRDNLDLQVRPIEINEYGQLKIVHTNGQTQLLTSEYLI